MNPLSIEATEAARAEVWAAISMRGAKGRRVRFPIYLADRLARCFNDLAAVKSDLRDGDDAPAARLAQHVQERLDRLAPKLPPDVATHVRRAGEHLGAGR